MATYIPTGDLSFTDIILTNNENYLLSGTSTGIYIIDINNKSTWNVITPVILSAISVLPSSAGAYSHENSIDIYG
jgi:hypothetical protein